MLRIVAATLLLFAMDASAAGWKFPKGVRVIRGAGPAGRLSEGIARNAMIRLQRDAEDKLKTCGEKERDDNKRLYGKNPSFWGVQLTFIVTPKGKAKDVKVEIAPPVAFTKAKKKSLVSCFESIAGLAKSSTFWQDLSAAPEPATLGFNVEIMDDDTAKG